MNMSVSVISSVVDVAGRTCVQPSGADGDRDDVWADLRLLVCLWKELWINGLHVRMKRGETTHQHVQPRLRDRVRRVLSSEVGADTTERARDVDDRLLRAALDEREEPL